MYNQNFFKLIICIVCVGALNIAFCCAAEKDDMKLLPGSSLSLEKVLSCPYVFLGKVIKISSTGPDAPGQETFLITITITNILKGSLKGELILYVTPRTLPVNVAEQTPQVGAQYIFFVRGESRDSLDVVRMMSDAPETVECIKMLIKTFNKKGND